MSKLLALPSRWKQGAFMMQLFAELDLFEGGQTEKEKRMHCAREDNVLGLRFLPITTDGFYRGATLHSSAGHQSNHAYPPQKRDRTASSPHSRSTNRSMDKFL